MTSTVRIILLLLSSLVLLSSCTVLRPRSLFKDQICPPPPSQACFPKRFTGPILDTTSAGKERFMRIRPLEGLNSPVIDEWNLSFLGDSTIWNTASAGGSQILRSIRLYSEQTVSEIITPEMEEHGSLGFVTGDSRTTIGARVSSNAYPGDADIIASDLSTDVVKPLDRIGVSSLLHWDSHPALSPNGELLFFTSDRLGSIKGTDLYVAVKDGNAWSEPMNCGDMINSRCDELSPFVTKQGNMLLFSSSGHANLGGYDIFSTMFDPQAVKKAVIAKDSSALAGAFEQPSNIGAPINTVHDELFPSSPSARIDTLLYYSSNQSGSDEDFGFDLFVYHPAYQYDTIKQTPIVQWQMKSPTLKKADKLDPKTIITIEGKVIDEESKKPVKNAEVTTTLYPENEIIDQQMTDTAGRYTVKVTTNRPVRISAESDELFENAMIYTFSMSDSNAVLADPLQLPKTIALRINFPTNEFNDPYPFVLDSNGNETTVSYQQAILKVAQNLQRFQQNIGSLAIIGHTDEIGNNEYNMKLGQKRADFIVKQLVKLGVPANLLKSESKGEESLPKKRITEDNDTYNKRCRRVELFKLIR